MTEETIVMKWGDTEEEGFRAFVNGRGDARPRIMVLGEPPEITEDLAHAFSKRGWEIVAVDDVEAAADAIADVTPSAFVLPIELAQAVSRRLLKAACNCHPTRYVPLIAYAGGVESNRARAWIAGCDGFVPHSAGSAALCREVKTLLVIARDLEPLLSRLAPTHVRSRASADPADTR